jgi:hypothetical protein
MSAVVDALDLQRLTLSGSVVPARVRAGFHRTWSLQIVSDMWHECSERPTVHVSVNVRPALFAHCVAVELVGMRLSVSVHDPPIQSCASAGVSFTVELDAAVAGRVVLPLRLGPITVEHRLPSPVPPAPWSRVIPLRGLDAPLCINEAQDASSVIASSTWDPGVLLAALLAEAASTTDSSAPWAHLLPRERNEPLRCVEVGSGCGVAGLSLAAAMPNSRVLLTDEDARACALARQNAAANTLGGRVSAMELTWREVAAPEVASACALLGGAPHLVLAADVVYRDTTFAALVATLASLCDAAKRPHARQRGGAQGEAGASGGTTVLFAYRPRMEDSHFFHLLHEEFEMSTVLAAGAANALLRSAVGGRAVDEATGGAVAHEVAGTCDHDITPVGATHSGAPCTIYQLRRREVRVPTSCRVCAQQRAAKVAAAAAIARAASGA